LLLSPSSSLTNALLFTLLLFVVFLLLHSHTLLSPTAFLPNTLSKKSNDIVEFPAQSISSKFLLQLTEEEEKKNGKKKTNEGKRKSIEVIGQ